MTHMEKVISKYMIRGPSSQVRLLNLGPKAVPFGPDGDDNDDYNDNAADDDDIGDDIYKDDDDAGEVMMMTITRKTMIKKRKN